MDNKKTGRLVEPNGLPHKCTTTGTYVSYAYAHNDRFTLGKDDIILGYDNNDQIWVLKKQSER